MSETAKVEELFVSRKFMKGAHIYDANDPDKTDFELGFLVDIQKIDVASSSFQGFFSTPKPEKYRITFKNSDKDTATNEKTLNDINGDYSLNFETWEDVRNGQDKIKNLEKVGLLALEQRQNANMLKQGGKKSKYLNRPSPPHPANQHCGEVKKGNDGKMYKSVPNKKGICTWKKVAKK